MLAAVTAVVCWLPGVAAPLGAREVATVTFVEGRPHLVRDGRPLLRRVEPGFGVESFDAIRTGEGETLELLFDRPPDFDLLVRVAARSHVSIHLTAPGAQSPGVLGLIAGSIAVSVRGLPRDSSLEVHSSAGTVRVRGTVFAVTLSPDGAMLVTAEAGVVEVRGPGGPTLYARRGEAVEIDVYAGGVRTLRFDGEAPQELQRGWLERRAAWTAEHRAQVVRLRGQSYRAARDGFTAAYAELMGHRERIDELMDAAERGLSVTGSRADEDSRLLEALVRVEAWMRELEPLYAVFDSLASHPGDEAPEVEIDEGYSAADLLQLVANDRRLMTERFATVRHVLKVSAELRDGTPRAFPEASP